MLASYETYLRTRFLEGENNVLGLFHEIQARGYTGSRMTVQRFRKAAACDAKARAGDLQSGDDGAHDSTPSGWINASPPR
jgi:hypothetical protein